MPSVTILGSTGSIGQSTLDVVVRHPDRFQVFALTAHSRIEELAKQCLSVKPRFAVVSDQKAAERLREQLSECTVTEVLYGAEGLCEVASHPDVDMVMAAIVGAVGLKPTLAAVKAGKKVLLANKESLVMAGELFMQAVANHDAILLPIDSEHNAIFQCLPESYQVGSKPSGIRKILLSGSGGPFRTRPFADLHDVTPQQACKHPNWDMGQKISVDSATMMNKGLELIEACWLFNLKPGQIEIVIHPQSIVHSLVEYEDGSILAQMGNPDMRIPIANGLAWPERIDSGVASLDLVTMQDLTFSAPDLEQFPSLRLAIEAANTGMTAPVALNAANEVAVSAFLEGTIRYTAIPDIVEKVLEQSQFMKPNSLEVVEQADAEARDLARQLVMVQKH